MANDPLLYQSAHENSPWLTTLTSYVKKDEAETLIQ